MIQTKSLKITLLVVVTSLVGIGLVMVLSASSVASISLYGNPWHLFFRQIAWICLGVSAMTALAFFDYHHLKRLRSVLVALTTAGLVLVLVPGIGVFQGGSRRWIGFGPATLQPSEVAKFVLVIFCADLIASRFHTKRPLQEVLLPIGLVSGVMIMLVLIEPDMGTALLMGAIVMGLLFMSQVQLKHIAALIVVAITFLFVYAMSASYRRARLLSFLHPAQNTSASGYQMFHSLITLSTGHIFGVGSGVTTATWGLLPNSYTDFIFAVIGQEWGLMGALLVIALFVVFTYIGLAIARRAPDRFGALLGWGITWWIALQALLNISAVIGIVPVTGVPLPFISFGGSSLVMIMAGCGILFNVLSQIGAKRLVLKK